MVINRQATKLSKENKRLALFVFFAGHGEVYDLEQHIILSGEALCD